MKLPLGLTLFEFIYKGTYKSDRTRSAHYKAKANTST